MKYPLSFFPSLLILLILSTKLSAESLPEIKLEAGGILNNEEGIELLPLVPFQRTSLPKDQIQQDFWGRDSKKAYYLQGSENNVDGAAKMVTELLETLEPYQQSLGTRVNRLGQVVDEWLGGGEHFQRTRSNRLEVSFPLTYGFYNNEFSLNPQVQAKLYFPNTNRRWSLMVESAQNNINTNGATAQTQATPNLKDEQAVNITLQKLVIDNQYFKVRTDLGGSFNGLEPDPLAGLRLEYLLPTSDIHQNTLIHKAYWQRLKGNVFDTLYRHDWLLDSTRLFRSDSQAIWWHSDQYWDLSQTLTVYQNINQHRNFAYTLRSDWQTQRGYLQHLSYGAGWGWREDIFQKWVYASLNPYLNWRHDLVSDRYVSEPSITLSLEVHFFQDAAD